MDIIPTTKVNAPSRIRQMTNEEAYQQSDALEERPPMNPNDIEMLKHSIPDDMIVNMFHDAQRMSMGMVDYMQNACQTYNDQIGL